MAYVIVTVLTATLTASIAVADFVRAEFVLTNSAEVGVDRSWLPGLGSLKLLGAIGLCVGLLGSQAIGVMAAGGLAVFFIGAVAAHIRAGVYRNIAFPIGYLALAVASLVLAVVH